MKELSVSISRRRLVAALIIITAGSACCSGAQTPGYSIPVIDLAGDTARQVIVDREPGQYLGHPTTVLLEDNKTMITVYPKGHGSGAIVMKRSTDAGLTWSERLPTPQNWATSKEVPTIHRVASAWMASRDSPVGQGSTSGHRSVATRAQV